MHNLILLLTGLLCLAGRAAAMAAPASFTLPGEDSIRVPEKYRALFAQSLGSIFGYQANYFGYTATGALVFRGDPMKLPLAERRLYRKLEWLMVHRVTTKVVYERRYEEKDPSGIMVVVDTRLYRGEGTALVQENKGLLHNYIVVDPAGPTMDTVDEVTEAYYTHVGTGMQEAPRQFWVRKVPINPFILTWHGLGHVFHAGETLDRVVDFDNEARRLFKTRQAAGVYRSDSLVMQGYNRTHNRLYRFYSPEEEQRLQREAQERLRKQSFSVPRSGSKRPATSMDLPFTGSY